MMLDGEDDVNPTGSLFGKLVECREELVAAALIPCGHFPTPPLSM
jgi:hypothetical protein